MAGVPERAAAALLPAHGHRAHGARILQVRMASLSRRGRPLRREDGNAMSPSADELINEYLDRLERELADFPSARRRELVQEISGHIAEARAQLDSESEADVRNLLDRIGDPADIAVEARGEAVPARPAPPAKGSGALDVVAMILLLIGGIVLPVVGWFVGVVLLWISGSWTTNEK